MTQEVLIQPLINRIFHWLIALGFTLLVMTGLYIHYPIITAPYITMTMAEQFQFSVGFITTGLVIARVYYGIVTADYKNILFRLADVKPFGQLIQYYLFLRKKEPAHAKYNAGQKLIYTSWVFLFFFQFFTGILLYYPFLASSRYVAWPLQTIRFYHYLVALWFLGTIPVHIYLVLTADPGRLQAIFTGWARIAKQKS